MTFEEWHNAHYPDDAAILKMHEEGSPLMAVEVIGARIAKRNRSKAYAAGREARPVCLWNNVDGCWETTCGNAFEINDGTPSENNMAYCCYCGGKVEENSHDF